MQPAATFVDLELVQMHLTAAAEHAAAEASLNFRRGAEGALRHVPSLQFDSPLEVLFWLWWDACTAGSWLADLLSLQPQAEVLAGGQSYRVDFLIEPTDPLLAASPAWNPIAVEVDGHAFHVRTLG